MGAALMSNQRYYAPPIQCKTLPEIVPLLAMWRPKPKRGGLRTSHSEKLIKKIKTPGTHRSSISRLLARRNGLFRQYSGKRCKSVVDGT
jgi:hypothetical protein